VEAAPSNAGPVQKKIMPKCADGVHAGKMPTPANLVHKTRVVNAVPHVAGASGASDGGGPGRIIRSCW
jgi:hypothetical protein